MCILFIIINLLCSVQYQLFILPPLPYIEHQFKIEKPTRRRAKTDSAASTAISPILEKSNEDLSPRTSTPVSEEEGQFRFKKSASMMSFLQAVEESKEYLEKSPPKAILRTVDPAEEEEAMVLRPSERRRSWTGRDLVLVVY